MHPVSVGSRLIDSGYVPQSVEVIVAHFHDIYEDCPGFFSEGQVEEEFGIEVEETLRFVTDPPGTAQERTEGRIERIKKGVYLPGYAVTIADLVDNILSMDSGGWKMARQEKYYKRKLSIFKAIEEMVEDADFVTSRFENLFFKSKVILRKIGKKF